MNILLGDIGGTNARLALLEGSVISPICTFAVGAHASFEETLEHFLAGMPADRRPGRALLAVAGPIEQDRCKLTNAAWVIEAGRVNHRFGFRRTDLVNDFAAVTWALPRLTGADLLQLGGAAADRASPSIALGPGTGLGIGCFVPTREGGMVLATEGGHATVPYGTPQENAVIASIARDRGHVSIESLLSGPGLVHIYGALRESEHIAAPARDAAGIVAAARDGSCAASRSALAIFTALLGVVAGDLALTFGARGGVYLAGGIAPRIGDMLQEGGFRRRFEDKGRLSGYVAAIPVYLVLRENPAFIGLKALLEQERVKVSRQS